MRQISKTQIIDMPIKVSDFTNDAGYVTKSVSGLTNYYTKAEVDVMISGLVDRIAQLEGNSNV